MRRLLAFLTFSLSLGLVVAADPPKPTEKDKLDELRKTAAFDQERLRQQYNAFQQSLLNLAQRLEKSTKAEDRDKAAALREAISLAAKEGIDNQFNKLVATLTGSGVTLRDIEGAIGQNDQLTKTLREMIALLLSDNSAKAKDEQKKLAELLKQLDKVIRSQKVERSKVESGKGDKDDLAKGQNKVTKETEDLAKALDKGKAKDGKDGDPEKGEPKKGDPKDGDLKKVDPKKGDPKDGDAKKGDPKKGDPKDGDPKKGDPKDGDPKKGEPKKGQPKDGQPPDGGDPPDGDPKPPEDQPEPPDQLPGRKQVKDAIENQNKAEEKIKKDERKKASDEQDEAIKKLEEVRKEIERRLKQLREEEMERLLANLENRVNRMLSLQIEVYEATKRLHVVVQAQPDKRATRNEDLKSGELSTKEGQIVIEANKALQLLAEEGSAVAFLMVLGDVRDQMKIVQARLFKTDVSPFTQSIEEDIIASLKEMVAALKKAQQDLKDKKDQPPPPPPPGGQKPPSKLLDMLAELKMIKSLQEQINKRTKAYASQYPGEQADDPDIRKELQGLSGRQDKVHKVTKDIATGKNQGQ